MDKAAEITSILISWMIGVLIALVIYDILSNKGEKGPETIHIIRIIEQNAAETKIPVGIDPDYPVRKGQEP